MTKRLTLRPLTKAERTVLFQIDHSQTAPWRHGERAKMILLAHEGHRVVDIAEKLDRTPATVYTRFKRFNADGLSGLDDKSRGGLLPIYTEEERGLKALGDAINQLLSYITWRYSKSALILFVKNKEFSPVLEKIDIAAKVH